MLTQEWNTRRSGRSHDDECSKAGGAYQSFKLLVTVAALCAALLAGGCSGVTDFTGGGVPVGPSRSQLSGQVVQSANPSQSVAGATLTLTTADNSMFTGVADAAGAYTFVNIPAGPATLQVSPPDGSGLRAQTLSVDVNANSTFAVLAALPSRSGYALVSSITLSPSSLNLPVGQSATVVASIQGKDIPAGAQPSLVVRGGVGQVFPGGRFVATHSGSGSITASLDGQTASIPVTVQ